MITKILSFIKRHSWEASTFVLGIIVVILITKTFDKIIPSSPVVIKEFTDTVKVVHSYELPKGQNEDSINIQLQKKINQISQLNLYEKEIDKYFSRINQKESTQFENIPNKIILNSKNNIASKGYVQEIAAALFNIDCPTFEKTQKHFDFHINFISEDIIKDIFCLRLIVSKKQNNNFNHLYFDEIYEPRSKNNFIRINSDLPKGQYEFRIGVILNKDLNEKYPPFFYSVCYLSIE